MKLEIMLEGQVLHASDLPADITAEEDRLNVAMRVALKAALIENALAPSQALRCKFRLIDNRGKMGSGISVAPATSP
jgi:hypothetical protein